MNAWYEIRNADSVPSPTLLLYPDRIEENIRRMIRMAGDVAKLRPHVKTHKLSQVVKMKRAAGIDKFKTSTIAEAEMTAAVGGRDILLAYQPVGPAIGRLATLIERFPETRFTTLVDNPASLQQIAKEAVDRGITIGLFIDLNVGMDRTGIAPGDEAAELYAAITQTQGVEAAGVHAYDGHLHLPDLEDLKTETKNAFTPVWALIERLQGDGYPVPGIIASGTATSPLLAEHEGVEVGAGTTVLWDHGQPELSPHLDFLNAAVLLARVISRPTANRLCIDLGHKAVASEMPQPRVHFFGLEEARAVLHSEEHLVLETDRASDYPVGTVLYGVPQHICPTVALHSEVWVVRDHCAAETWPVIARTRRLSI